MPLTIQLKDLPAHCNNPAFASKLVQPLGALIDAGLFSSQLEGRGSHFIKCIVKVDLLKSLQGRIQAPFGDKRPLWIRLRYEDLPTVCFTCGLLGHGHDHCPYSAILRWNPQERGAWMLAKPHGHKVEIAELTDASTSHQKNKYLKPVPYEFHTYVTVTPSDAGASSSGTKGPPPSGALPDSVISVTDVPICDGTLLSSNCSRHIGFHCFTNNDLDFLSISVAGKSKERLEIDNCPPILSIAKANDSFLLSFSHLCNAFVCYVPHYNTNYDSSLRLFDFPPASLDLQVFK
ncbi:hypothetical protein LINGRAHAP2_LOCUS1922 [Linum grandiflorum]